MEKTIAKWTEVTEDKLIDPVTKECRKCSRCDAQLKTGDKILWYAKVNIDLKRVSRVMGVYCFDGGCGHFVSHALLFNNLAILDSSRNDWGLDWKEPSYF